MNTKKTPQGKFDCFNLGTGNGVSVLELIKATEEVTGKIVNLQVCERREGDPPLLIADNGKAGAELQWTPKHSGITEIVDSAYRWAQQRKE